MQSRSYRSFGVTLALLALLLSAAVGWAQTPQTIVIDGINDFDPGNVIDVDGADTQFPNIDLEDIYVTNDAVSLFIGAEHDQAGWTLVQLGIAIDVNTADGGTTDPWGRQIEWTLAPLKPDFMFYINLDNNWQAGYSWSGSAWTELAVGPNALGWAGNTGGFKELGILLATLGVTASDDINVEMWVTQDAANKGPLDCMANDASQLSTPSFTLWETSTPIPLTDMLTYTVQAAADPDPPVVTGTERTDLEDFPAESFFDVYFNEPVALPSAQNPANYTISGGDGLAHPVVVATRDASQPNIVHLEVGVPMSASGNLYQVTVTGVKDLAGNTIVNNGVTNVGCFLLKNMLFRGRMSAYLASNSSPPDGFSVEGDVVPLTFGTTCDTGNMTDTGTDDIWEYENVFHIGGDCGTGTALQEVQWKFNHNCTTYEPLGSNRVHTITEGTGATDTLDFWWNDEDPSQFTSHDIDVELFVDLNVYGYLPGDVVAINGSELPLTHDVPSLNELVDDGTG
ncbi:MAG: Ig-like domain-containing protein, partial [bacterium]